jgi:hypothetical protein
MCGIGLKRLKISKSWILLLLIILLISIWSSPGIGTWAQGLDTINNLSYNSENNDLTYYNDFREKAYSYDLDSDIWKDADWVERPPVISRDGYTSFSEHLLVGTVNITIVKHGLYRNNFTVFFEEINSGQNASIQVYDFEKIYNYNNTIYILHQDGPERAIHSDDEIFYHMTRVKIDNYYNGTFSLSDYTMDFFDSIIPGEFSRGNSGLTHLYETIEGKLIYITIPAIYSFDCNDTGVKKVIKYEQARGESYSPYITFHKNSSSMLIRFRMDDFNVTLQYFKFYEDSIVKEQEWEYSVFVSNTLGPQVFINETTVVISDYREPPGSKILTIRDGEVRGTTWLYFMNLETGVAIPIYIPDHISRDGFQPFVYFIEYFDWALPVIIAGLILIYIIERTVKLTKFIIIARQKNKMAQE